MGWRDYQKATVQHDSTDIPDPLVIMEREYRDTMTRFRSPESESLPIEEFHNMLCCLDTLSQELTRQGVVLPVNTDEGRRYLREEAA